ncbi:uncharacterized protein LOC6581489 [Drosophila mojavensis]|uniref:Uncharacterized protein n=1 Tax=Drosophila mojavensis TaxID=7230 RepID=B4KYB4_DROMO|nr:uncharacterized protein LOC6581489 [Drosophila mojavensis]EDW17693.1 uncharacterized protein Dmoj_GI12501 [Drosophila mojavensis]
MPPRRSERLRLQREDASPAQPGAEPRAEPRSASSRPVRRRSHGTRAAQPARQARMNAVVVPLDQRHDPRTWLQLEAHRNSRALASHSGEVQTDDAQTLRLLSVFIRIALLESPSLAQLTRRNPSQGIRKLFRIIRFLFFRR